MARRKPVKAEELMTQLEADAEWVAKRDARERELDERRAVYAADQAEMISEIRSIGFDIDSVYDFVNNTPHPHIERRFLGGYSSAYPVLLRHLDVPHLDRVREGIIRALTIKDGGKDVENALLAHFQTETDPNLRWVLANALLTAVPYHRRKKYPDIAAVLAGKTRIR